MCWVAAITEITRLLKSSGILFRSLSRNGNLYRSASAEHAPPREARYERRAGAESYAHRANKGSLHSWRLEPDSPRPDRRATSSLRQWSSTSHRGARAGVALRGVQASARRRERGTIPGPRRPTLRWIPAPALADRDSRP